MKVSEKEWELAESQSPFGSYFNPYAELLVASEESDGVSIAFRLLF